MNLKILFQKNTYFVENIKQYSDLEKCLFIQIPYLTIENIWYSDEEDDQIQVSNTNDLLAINNPNQILLHVEGYVNQQQINNNKKKVGRWAKEEDQKLLRLHDQFGEDNWNIISEQIESRSTIQCQSRYQKLKNNIQKQLQNGEECVDQEKQLIKRQNEQEKRQKEIREKIQIIESLKKQIQEMDNQISQQKQNHYEQIRQFEEQIEELRKHKIDPLIDFGQYLKQLQFSKFVEQQEQAISMLEKQKDYDQLLIEIEKKIIKQFQMIYENRIYIIENNYEIWRQNQQQIRIIQKSIENNKKIFMKSLQQLNDNMRDTNNQIFHLEQLIKSLTDQ